MASEGMQRLNTASSFKVDGNPHLIQVKYRTGAKFEGKVIDHKKSGRGLFIWPNGSKYDGDFSDNLRHGKGTQVWSDGSSYSGDFLNDLRHGEGNISWSNGETYKGTFFKDRRHGFGLYTWPDGSSYKGTFYMDRKEGYGKFTFANGNTFQGLYREDEREGPGVVTYKDSEQQDVGLWRGEKLIKLCSRSPGAFTITAHPEFDYREEEHIIYLEDLDAAGKPVTTSMTHRNSDPACSQLAPVRNVLHPPPALDYPPSPDLTQKINELYSEALDPRSLAVDRLTFDIEFFKGLAEHAAAVSASVATRKGQKNSKPVSNTLSATAAPTQQDSNSNPSQATKTPVWNATPAMVSLQRHTLKHSVGKFGIDLDIDAVIQLDRSKFKAKGPLESQSEELIEAAGAGDVTKVETLLSSGMVHPDVADCKGHTALIGAAVNWHMDVINVLLNQGSNVNKLSDEGCSALSAGTIFYYPIEGFLYNIAERYMSPPDEELVKVDPDCPGQPPPPPGILANNRERRASRLNQINRIKLDSKGKVTTQSGPNRKKSIGTKKQKSDQHGIKILKTRPSKEMSTDLVANVEKSDADIFNVDDDEDDDNGVEGDGNENFINDDDRDSAYGGDLEDGEKLYGEEEEEEGPEDFESNQSLRNYHIEVTEQLVERCATQLSHNELVVSREVSSTGVSNEVGKARRLAIQMSHHERMKETLDLLLRRGADPNSSSVPMPVLFFAIKSADVEMVKQLLIKGADTNSRLSQEKGGLYPVHIAAAIPGEEGVQITELLLDALADPNARAHEDDSFLNTNLEEEWSKDVISDQSRALLGGRTALQIACARDDNYKNSCRVVRLLLEHKADTSLICNGFSPLTLAIASGNDLAIDELLLFGADPSLPLTHGVGSALCVASSTEHEHRRTIQGQIHLVKQ
ncbi:ankyrin repeat and MYND domain-containing protein 1 [Elysia marginata]|uniref:Ankyrin repeat and MYND domain-containing protein 1 n=1 Tax=Elysia marginata TaxID=1093978 RepID=A0AAV4EHQ5_9GAST|nr:ankyrin repeat and MYND domain-containing protein 1 [Elysia marginata]